MKENTSTKTLQLEEVNREKKFKPNPKKGSVQFYKNENEKLLQENAILKGQMELLLKRIKAEIRLRQGLANVMVAHLELGTVNDPEHCTGLRGLFYANCNLIQE